MPEVVRHAIESGSRENLIAVLNELTTRKQENGLVPDEIRAVRPFGAGLLTQYAEWLLTAQSDPTSWLRTSPIKSQMRSKQSRRLEVDVSAMVPPTVEKKVEGRLSSHKCERSSSGSIVASQDC